MRCEGWRRYGGALSFGLPRWEQCEKTAIVILKVQQEGKVETLPGCKECWEEAIEKKIKILEVTPIPTKKKKSAKG